MGHSITTGRQREEWALTKYGQWGATPELTNLTPRNSNVQSNKSVSEILFEKNNSRKLVNRVTDNIDQTAQHLNLSLAGLARSNANPIEKTASSSTASGWSTIKSKPPIASESLVELISTRNNVSFSNNYSLPNHQPLRCACFACRSSQGNENTGEPFESGGPTMLENGGISDPANSTNEEITTTLPNVGFYSKSSSEVQDLTLDSLAALNSPYISCTFVGAKWGYIYKYSGASI